MKSPIVITLILTIIHILALFSGGVFVWADETDSSLSGLPSPFLTSKPELFENNKKNIVAAALVTDILQEPTTPETDSPTDPVTSDTLSLNLLSANDPQAHRISAEEDSQWFGFTMSDDADVSLKTQVYSGDIGIEVYDGDEMILELPVGEVTPETLKQVLSEGDYRLKVSGTEGTAYTIEVREDEDGTALPEANDIRETADILTPDVAVRGSIAPGGDEDWFQFTLDSDANISIELLNLDWGVNGDILPELYDKDGIALNTGTSKSDDSASLILSTENVNSTISGLLATGTWYLRVSGAGNTRKAVSYQVLLTSRPSVTEPPVATTDLMEPNGTIALATPLEMGAAVETVLNTKDDTDWFRFEVNQKSPVILETWPVDAISASGTVQISVYRDDSSETPVVTGSVSSTADFFRIEKNLSEGSYYVKVDGGTLATYTISLSNQEAQFERVPDGLLDGRSAGLYVDEAGPPAFADMDGDGDLDMILGSLHGRLRQYRNDGSPGFAVWTLVTETFADADMGRWSRIVPAMTDIDGDGDVDIFVADGADILFYENTGTAYQGIWTTVNPLWLSVDTGYRISSLKFRDIDGDGDPDLLAGGIRDEDAATWKLFVFENTGTSGKPEWRPDTAHPLTTLYTGEEIHFDLADIDGDGDPDFWVHQADGTLVYHENTGTAETPVWNTAPVKVLKTDSGPDRIAFADMDNDGDADLWLENILYTNRSGNGAAAFVRSDTDYLHRLGFWWFTLADIDGDGDPDLFAGDQEDGNGVIRFYRNDGTPFSPSWHLADSAFAGVEISDGWAVPVFADIDGDGDLDLFAGTGNDSGGRLYFYRNTGTAAEPVWIPEQTDVIRTDTGPVSVAFGDLDGDGDLDMLAGSMGKTLSFYRNTGTAAEPVWTLESSDYISGCGEWPVPELHDVDGDGDLDLFVGNAGGNLRHYRNNGTSAIPVWTLATMNYGGVESRYEGTVPVFSDTDSDGDPDLFIGTQGGLHFYRNTATHLHITPVSRTLTSGSTFRFTVEGATEPVTWRIVSGDSGGTVNSGTGEYRAGTVADGESRIDTIEASDGAGLTGRAFVNIISASDASSAGKAIIIAGRKENDNVWAATRYMAEFAYQSLKYRGFDDENIYYLGNTSDTDAAGDITPDGPATLDNLRYAFEVFAKNTDSLIVYFVDHGDLNGGTDLWFRVNPSEILTAETLDTWLDALQDGDCRISVVVDCCYSGSALKFLKPPEGKERVVIASTGVNAPTYYISDGMVSFSQAFFSTIYSGGDLMSAFETAAAAMSRFQTPVMDDTGDGIYEPETDGALARTRFAGAGYTGGSDRPAVGQISTNLQLDMETGAVIWAEDVSGTWPVTKVWAVIVPPGLNPDPGEPVDDLPQAELLYNEDAERYEAEYDGFTDSGIYTVLIYARDIWNGVSTPKQMYVTRSDLDERVILINGSDGYADTARNAGAGYLAGYVYQTFRDRWIDADNILFLTPGNPAGADALPTRENMWNAVNKWAKTSRKLTLYFIGAGESNGFRLNADERITPAELAGLLNGFQADGTRQVMVVLDADHAGNWLSVLSPGPDMSRLVISAVSEDGDALMEANGRMSFSQYFMNHVLMGRTMRDAFIGASEAVRFVQGPGSDALLDDNGNGRGNEKPGDGSLAAGLRIGSAFVTGSGLPVIGTACNDTALTSGSATIWAGDVSDGDGIAQVRASVIPPPDARSQGAEIRDMALDYNADTGRYETLFTGFTHSGAYTVLLYAQDTKGYLSEPVRRVFSRDASAGEIPAGLSDAAVLVPSYDGELQDFGTPGEADWFRFYGIAGEVYTIEAANPEENCDVVIELYDTDGITRIGFQDTPLDAQAVEQLDWTCPEDGIYYVKFSHYNPDISGDGTGYTAKIYHPAGSFAGFLTGLVTDANTGEPVADAVVKTTTNGADITRVDGTYLMLLPAATFDLTVEAAGYSLLALESLVLEEGETRILNLEITAESGLRAAIVSPAENMTIEAGASPDFQGTASGGTEPFSWSWDFGGGAENSTLQSPGPVVFSTPGIYTVQLTVTDASGLKAVASRTITVTYTVWPDAPILLLPEDDAVGTGLTPTLQTGPFVHPAAGRTHARTLWQISTLSDFSTFVFTLDTTSALTILDVPELMLETGTVYYWRVRFYDDNDNMSDWSAVRSFTTVEVSPDDADEDGVPDNQEVDESVDLDANGVPDVSQSGIKCVRTADGANIIGVECSGAGCDVEAVRTIAADALPGDIPGTLPLDMINFRITVPEKGGSALIIVRFSSALPDDARWYKYNPANNWQDYTSSVEFSADRKAVTLTLTDGGPGDADGAVNGVIVDPAGAVIVDTPVNPDSGGGGGCFITDRTKRMKRRGDSFPG